MCRSSNEPDGPKQCAKDTRSAYVGDMTRYEEQVNHSHAISAQLAPPNMTREPLVASDVLQMAELQQSMTSMALQDATRGQYSSEFIPELRADTIRYAAQIDTYRQFDDLDRQHSSVDDRNMAAIDLHARLTAQLQTNERSAEPAMVDGHRSALKEMAAAYRIPPGVGPAPQDASGHVTPESHGMSSNPRAAKPLRQQAEREAEDARAAFAHAALHERNMRMVTVRGHFKESREGALGVYRKFDDLDHEHTSTEARNNAARALFASEAAKLSTTDRAALHGGPRAFYDGQCEALLTLADTYKLPRELVPNPF